MATINEQYPKYRVAVKTVIGWRVYEVHSPEPDWAKRWARAQAAQEGFAVCQDTPTKFVTKRFKGVQIPKADPKTAALLRRWKGLQGLCLTEEEFKYLFRLLVADTLSTHGVRYV